MRRINKKQKVTTSAKRVQKRAFDLQIQWGSPEGGLGGFDSHAPPPFCFQRFARTLRLAYKHLASGDLPLHVAAADYETGIAEELVSRGANVSARSDSWFGATWLASLDPSRETPAPSWPLLRLQSFRGIHGRCPPRRRDTGQPCDGD